MLAHQYFAVDGSGVNGGGHVGPGSLASLSSSTSGLYGPAIPLPFRSASAELAANSGAGAPQFPAHHQQMHPPHTLPQQHLIQRQQHLQHATTLHQQQHHLSQPQQHHHPSLHPQPPPSSHLQHHRILRSGRPQPSMSSGQDQYVASEEELAHLQKLSAEYEPEQTGPLVSERQSTSNITSEYATADPIYRTKTAALPQKYHEYRTCRGDGHCGWRAIAFTYFETLQRLGDADKFDSERVRLTSLRNLLNNVGFSQHLFEDFEEEALDLLQRLRNDANGENALLAAFNDEGTSMAIITYIKLLTSAWMKSHVADYSPFLGGDDQAVYTYCATYIEPSICELEHMSLSALVDVLLKPAGIALEIGYLDRSIGTEINWHAFVPNPSDAMSSGHGLPTVRLLYRPGHYDILYKLEDVRAAPAFVAPQAPPPLNTNNVFVGLASSVDDFMPSSRTMSDVFTMIPGMYPSSSFGQPPGFNQGPFGYTTPSPVSPIPQSQMAPLPGYTTSHAPPPPSHVPVAHSVSSPQEYCPPPVSLETTIGGPMRSLNLERAGPFRPSAYEFDLNQQQQHPLPFQTSIFRNSHFNTAHYLNPDFQPEEWSPDAEYVTGNNRSRHKSSSS